MSELGKFIKLSSNFLVYSMGQIIIFSRLMWRLDKVMLVKHPAWYRIKSGSLINPYFQCFTSPTSPLYTKQQCSHYYFEPVPAPSPPDYIQCSQQFIIYTYINTEFLKLVLDTIVLILVIILLWYMVPIIIRISIFYKYSTL